MADPLDDARAALAEIDTRSSALPGAGGADAPTDPLADARAALSEIDATAVPAVPAPDKYAIDYKEPETPVLKYGQKFMSGFYNNLADTLGLPAEAVNEILGHAGIQWLDKGGNAQKAIRAAFAKVGLGTYQGKAKDIMGTLGEGTATAVLSYFGMRALSGGTAGVLNATAPTAPIAPATTVMGKVANAGRAVHETARSTAGAMAEGLVTKPVTSLTGTIAAVPGAHYVGEALGAGGEALGGAVAGETGAKIGGAIGQGVGSVIGGMVTGVPVVKVAGRMGMIPKTERGIIPAAGTPLIDPASNPQAAKDLAAAQNVRTLDALEQRARNAVGNLSRLTEAEASERVAAAIDRSHQAGRAVEHRLWSLVPSRAAVPEDTVERLVRFTQTTMNTHLFAKDAAPTNRMGEFLQGIAQREANGRPTSILDLKQLREGLMRDYAKNRTVKAIGQVENRPLGKQILKYVDKIDDAIEASLSPADQQSLLRARDFSRNLNQRFTRGGPNEVRTIDQAGNVPDNSDLMNKLLTEKGKARGLTQIDAAMQPQPTGMPGMPPSIRTPAVGYRAAQQRTPPAVDEGIRAWFKDEIMGPRNTAANDVTGTPASRLNALKSAGDIAKADVDPRITAYARAGQQIAGAMDVVREQLTRVRDFGKSAVVEFTQKTPEAAAKDIVNSTDPQGAVRQIMAQLNKAAIPGQSPQITSQAAIEGLQHAVVRELMDSKNITAAAARFRIPRVQEAVRALFPNDPGAVRRIDNMFTAAESLLAGPQKSGDKLTRLVGTSLGGLLGLKFGHAYAGLMMGGSAAANLSLPAAGKRAAVKFVLNQLAGGDPMQLIAHAATNPKVEALLLSRLPETRAEMISFRRRVTALGGTLGDAHNAAVNRYVDSLEKDK